MRGAKSGSFFKPDAFTDAAYARFALKVTLALMMSYMFMSLCDWPSISTCLTTCFVIALGGVGQSAHKMVLRIAGAVLGGVLGFAYTLFVTPALTDLGQLLVVMAPVVLLGAWIKAGSERTNYFGQQLTFAFLLVMLQDFGPTLHFQEGRDRVIGILVGETAFAIVFLHIWPVSVGDLVRKGTSDALDHLAAAITANERARGIKEVQVFADRVAKVRGLLIDRNYEGVGLESRRRIFRLDGEALALVQALAVPALVLGGIESQRSSETCGGDEARLASWLRDLATALRNGTGASTLAASLPRAHAAASSDMNDPHATWYQIFVGELHQVLAATGLEDDAIFPADEYQKAY